MRNLSLVQDYVRRAGHRLAAIDVLFERESWADVVRESQEVVELALKALVRHLNIEVPRIHDVSGVLEENRTMLSKSLAKDLPKLCAISRDLRRDRELAFYGSEDLTPSEFYKKADAEKARSEAAWVVSTVRKTVG